MRVLHAGAEVFPLVKTGGLADVMGALPPAQVRQGADVRLLLPGLPAVMDGVRDLRRVAEFGPAFGALRVRLCLASMPGTGLQAYVIDAPFLYRRGGGPYADGAGEIWADNLQRFALLGWVAAQLAAGDADPDWSADLVHAHDWHAGLACTYLGDRGDTPAAPSVFTVHNLAFQGLFPLPDAPLLGLSSRHLSAAGLEFHGQLSFMKAGLKYARCITTVSPTYAREITTPEFGFGLEGVIRKRGDDVVGILNGIDDVHWDPASDRALPANYDAAHLDGKRQCRAALQREYGLAADEAALVVGIVSRLTAQKGLDLVLAALTPLLAEGIQLVVQGSGDPALEAAFRAAQAAHPGRVAVSIGYDEARAHRLVAGADAILVPSRFEPCGLTQMYGLRYGTVPIVRKVGGLADTVVDAIAADSRSSNGFVFGPATPAALAGAVHNAARLHRDAGRWRQLQGRGMATKLSWAGPAQEYLALYSRLLAPMAARRGEPPR